MSQILKCTLRLESFFKIKVMDELFDEIEQTFIDLLFPGPVFYETEEELIFFINALIEIRYRKFPEMFSDYYPPLNNIPYMNLSVNQNPSNTIHHHPSNTNDHHPSISYTD